MPAIFANNSLTTGATPLVQLQRVSAGCNARILAKIEARNPAFSVKCRIGAAMVAQAERDGRLGPGKELIEPTSGNTGIALAFVAASRGVPLTLTMPDTMSEERRTSCCLPMELAWCSPKGATACLERSRWPNR